MADAIELEYTTQDNGSLGVKFLGEDCWLRREQFFEVMVGRGRGAIEMKRTGDKYDEVLIKLGIVRGVRRTVDGDAFEITADELGHTRLLFLPRSCLIRTYEDLAVVRCESKISLGEWRRIHDREHNAMNSEGYRRYQKKTKSRWWKCW